MIESIRFTSKARAIAMPGSEHVAMVSIFDPDELVGLAHGFHSVLPLPFLDIEIETEDSLSFTPALAATAAAFIRNLHSAQTPVELVVHCHAGVSRSAAVALAAYTLTGAEFKQLDNACYANVLVVLLLSEEIAQQIVIPPPPAVTPEYLMRPLF